ncbi:hypothetical protein GJ496_007502 [Pomphorhynchus laevis]|nr:hypothetical protein GJ496_007502 [Pomphorhynchus laevis]
MFEYGVLSLLVHSDSNWMWRALGTATSYNAASDSKADAKHPTEIPANDLPTVTILTARVLSNKVNFVFDNFNFGELTYTIECRKLEYIVL